ncbi:GGDEF domain-containing protein [Bacillus sp. V59.32b]|uniref:GGDEF domain-containing protein n=1 Tax=Bacillus sp. V59.32b TaxID=1758642 RepID=UPI000E3C977F|nr:GGDEF domain-containing protein [Bacillus sp. V59.32b]RFU60831.1 GGDEF domain-containing protein [Bacillus sp. V59.32b]
MFKEFQQLKRRIYLVVFPLFSLSLLVNQFHYRHSDSTLHFEDKLKDYLMLSWFLIGFLLLMIKKSSLRTVELITLGLVPIILFIYLRHILFVEIPREDVLDSGTFLFWAPFLFIAIFISLPKKQALIYALSIQTVNLVMTFFAYWQFQYPDDTTRILFNFFISQYVFIFAMFYFQELFKVFLKNRELEDMASTDYLTGLPNRRKIDQILNKQFRNGKAFSIILLDIDHFKAINDKYGHDIGDSVLKKISSLLSAHKKDQHFLGRWGGEEFIMIVTGGTNTEEEAERIRSIIEAHLFMDVQTVTASFGIATYEQGDDKRSLLNRADSALYLSKENGRNRVSVL